MMEDLIYKIGITRIPRVGPLIARNLIRYCGSPKAVFETRNKRELLRIPGVGDMIADNVLRQRALAEAESEIRFLERNDIRVLFFLDKEYPERLKHCPDSPIVLFFKGNADLDHPRIVAVVGTRRPTPQGYAFCEALIEELSPFNVLLVSGLAYGIDITAHRRCLDLKVPTLGVLGHGFNYLYPPQHFPIAERMAEHGGLLTEYLSFMKPDREHFPMRNRIIAGLCDALVVIETGRRGGSMISAEIANSYNKDVFAVPGRIGDTQSIGCNYLIKSHKASLIESAEDIALSLRWEEETKGRAIQGTLFADLSAEEKSVVDLLDQSAIKSIDQLTTETRMSHSKMAALLLTMEFKGLIKALPGKCFTLAHK